VSSTTLGQTKRDVLRGNLGLLKHGLVVGTSGNVSGRDPDSGLIVIKPSGVDFDDLTEESLCVVTLDGERVEGGKPSVDTASHLYVYARRPDIGGIVHTHSPFATSFALRGEPIDVFSTTHAALFGGPIPVSAYATIGEEEIGREIVANVGDGTAVLLRFHGVFTLGRTPDQALRAAIYVEESAQCAHFALSRGDVSPLPSEVVAASRAWYVSDYGQSPIESGA